MSSVGGRILHNRWNSPGTAGYNGCLLIALQGDKCTDPHESMGRHAQGQPVYQDGQLDYQP